MKLDDLIEQLITLQKQYGSIEVYCEQESAQTIFYQKAIPRGFADETEGPLFPERITLSCFGYPFDYQKI